MNASLRKEAEGVYRNLKNALPSLILKRVDLNKFYVSHEQVIVLSLIFLCVFFTGGFFLSLPDPEFSFYGMATVSTHLSLIALCGYFFSKVYAEKERMLQFYIVLLSMWPFFYLVWLLIGNSTFFNYWEMYGEQKFDYTVFNIWVAAVVVYSVLPAFEVGKTKVFQVLIVYVLTLGLPLNYLVFGNFWYQAYDFEAEYKKYNSVNQETTYYRQFQLIENTRAQLLPQRDGISGLYFVGFGSYAEQDVFMKEVQYAKRVLDEKFDTEGRSVALINNLSTLDNTLLASKGNLTLVLEHIGRLINPEEDVLFLYLTSHGSKKHQLSVKQRPLTLNTVGPSDLKQVLDSSGIKYRVLLVSACYSGGFIEPLKDDYTLVFTAAAKDKMSFGCGNLNDFTYFGEAIFKQQMNHNYDLVNVFNKAIESIHLREKFKKLEHSEPQLYVGDRIREKLLILAKEVNKEKKSNL